MKLLNNSSECRNCKNRAICRLSDNAINIFRSIEELPDLDGALIATISCMYYAKNRTGIEREPGSVEKSMFD